MAVVNQAAQLVGEGVATAGDVDHLFKGCLGHPMGPLRTADLIGLDTVVNTLNVLREARGEAIFEPADRLLELVRRGDLGLKTQRGFYDYMMEP
jgi:3-hydroxyacyl-CoA dehydrogenase